MVIISDTTTISNLFLIDKLWILQRLYKHIVIPKAVADELEKLKWGTNWLSNTQWIEQRTVTDTALVTVLTEVLDLGEAQAIALASECKADLLIIDELKGRNYAKKLNINVIGLIGILIQAKELAIIHSVKDVLNELKTKAGFWLNDELFKTALKLSNE